MAENSGIAWTDHTFNPWIGCTKVSAGCHSCYAELWMDKRYGKVKWGPNGTRVLTSSANWAKPLKWDRWAAEGVCPACGGKGVGFPSRSPSACKKCNGAGRGDQYRAKIFCASLADVFEDWTGPITSHDGRRVGINDRGELQPFSTNNDAPWEEDQMFANQKRWATLGDVRQRLFNEVIDRTPHSDWLMLTKRPENIQRMTPAVVIGSQEQADDRNERGELYRRNVWLGTSVAVQADIYRNVPLLLKCRELSPVLWVSAEPMLSELDFTAAFPHWKCPRCGWSNPTDPNKTGRCPNRCGLINQQTDGIDWVICGVESSGNRVGRLGEFATESEWLATAEDLGHQCREAGVAYFVKQIPLNGKLVHNLSEFPEALRVREYPQPKVAV